MVTGYELDFYRNIKRIANALEVISKELKKDE